MSILKYELDKSLGSLDLKHMPEFKAIEDKTQRWSPLPHGTSGTDFKRKVSRYTCFDSSR